MIKYSEEMKCKKCGKDISIKSFNLWKGHKVGDDFYCDDCFKAMNEAKTAETDNKQEKTVI